MLDNAVRKWTVLQTDELGQLTRAESSWWPSKVGRHELISEVTAGVHLVVNGFNVPLQVCNVVNYSLQSHNLRIIGGKCKNYICWYSELGFGKRKRNMEPLLCFCWPTTEYPETVMLNLVLVVVLKDSLRTKFKSLSLQVLVLVLVGLVCPCPCP